MDSLSLSLYLSLYYTHFLPLSLFLSLSLSFSHFLSLTFFLSLSFSHFLSLTFPLSLSLSHFLSLTFSLSLSRSHFISRSLPFPPPFNDFGTPQGVLFTGSWVKWKGVHNSWQFRISGGPQDSLYCHKKYYWDHGHPSFPPLTKNHKTPLFSSILFLYYFDIHIS